MSSRENEVAKEQIHFVQSNVLGKEHQVLLVLQENNGLEIRHYDIKTVRPTSTGPSNKTNNVLQSWYTSIQPADSEESAVQ
jgi:hypothetical protein